ncbi:MAG: hypothetical protein IJU16_07660, partial [Clostridia bacterium]|nr:hypothetical protein [Clostridia bacterium]
MVRAKHYLAIIAALALVMTAIFSVAGVTAAAEGKTIDGDFLKEEYIADGRDNITINSDGSWTVTGDFALSPYLIFDYAQVQPLVQTFITNVPVKITFLDRDPNGTEADPGYGDHWVGLYDNWVGPQDFPAGEYDRTDDMSGIWKWNTDPAHQDPAWGNTGTVAVRAIYFEFHPNTSVNATIKALKLNGSGYTSYAPEGEEGGDTTPTEAPVVTTKDLAPKDIEAWKDAPTSDSHITVKLDGEALVFGNTGGAQTWPGGSATYSEPIIVAKDDIADTAIAYDFATSNGATNIYLFFGPSTPEDFAADECYISLTDKVTGSADFEGAKAGEVKLSDLGLPEKAYNENGDLVITGVKVCAVGAESDEIVRLNKLELVTTKGGAPIDEDPTATTTTTAGDETTTTTAAAGTT